MRLAETDDVYEFDGLISIHNHEFMRDAHFRDSYDRGAKAAGDYQWYWRVHIGLWAAATATRLEGDFVECGVNRGFMSSAIMRFLDWDKTGKTFFLLDTFSGLDPGQIDDPDGSEAARNKKHIEEGFYVTDFESVAANFSEWRNIRLVRGAVPETLEQVTSEKVAFVHLDMNSAAPEVAAFEYLWEKAVTGSMFLLDDYAFRGYGGQKKALDNAAFRKSVSVLSLPTGQGLIVKT